MLRSARALGIGTTLVFGSALACRWQLLTDPQGARVSSMTIELVGWPDSIAVRDSVSLRVRVRSQDGSEVPTAVVYWLTRNPNVLALSGSASPDGLPARLGIGRRPGVDTLWLCARQEDVQAVAARSLPVYLPPSQQPESLLSGVVTLAWPCDDHPTP